MSNHVIDVKSCQSFVIWAFSVQTFSKVGRGGQGRGGEGVQKGLPKPSATASLSGRRQKYHLAMPYLLRSFCQIKDKRLLVPAPRL
jgi:hypothetical protein